MPYLQQALLTPLQPQAVTIMMITVYFASNLTLLISAVIAASAFPAYYLLETDFVRSRLEFSGVAGSAAGYQPAAVES